MNTRGLALLALVGFLPGCGGNLSNKAILAGRVRVILQLNPATAGTFNSLDPSWTGTWNTDITNPEPGIPVGATQASGSLSIARVDQRALTEFPVVGNLRRGFWSFSIVVNGDGATLFNPSCTAQEIPSDKTLRLVFTEGGQGCTTSVE
jgi:hypothetical protein